MKLSSLLFAGALLIGATACNKSGSDDPQPSQPGAGGSADQMTWTLGTTTTTASGENNPNVVTSSDTRNGVTKRTLIMVGNQYSSSNPRPGVRITLDNLTGPGTYALLPNGDNQAAAWEGGASGKTYSSYNMPASSTPVGQVVVSSYDASTRRLKGTFSFSGRSTGAGATTQQISNGSFDVRVLLSF